MNQQDIIDATSENTSFSKQVPGLQLAIDSTSLGEFKTCPRKYYYSIILGLQPRAESVHLTFGLLIHASVERYAHKRAEGQDHEQALRFALRWLLSETWNKTLSRPWISDHPAKNRLTAVRTLVWYLDQYGDNDSLEYVVLPNGKPAVELTFSFDSGISTISTGETITFSGHLDRVAMLNDEPYIVDIKTTTSALGPNFFAGFSPDNQFSMYTLAAQVAFATPVKGVIVDGAQVGATFARFERSLILRDASTMREWIDGTQFWLRRMEESAVTQSWPMNDKACGNYGGCPFRPICSRPPGARDAWLKSDYKKRLWDPLQRRGDI